MGNPTTKYVVKYVYVNYKYMSALSFVFPIILPLLEIAQILRER